MRACGSVLVVAVTTKTLNVRLPVDLVDALQSKAADEGRTLTELTRRAVATYLKETSHDA